MQVGALDDLSDFVEGETGTAGPEFRFVAVAEITEEVGFVVCANEEGFVDGCVVEAGHRAAIEAIAAGGNHEVGCLEGAVAEGEALGEFGFAFEHGLDVGVRPETIHLLVEVLVVGKDSGDWCLHGLIYVAGHEAGLEFFFGFGGADEDYAQGAAVHGGWAHLHLVVDLNQESGVYGGVEVSGEGAGLSEEKVKTNVVDSCHLLKDSGASVK